MISPVSARFQEALAPAQRAVFEKREEKKRNEEKDGR